MQKANFEKLIREVFWKKTLLLEKNMRNWFIFHLNSSFNYGGAVTFGLGTLKFHSYFHKVNRLNLFFFSSLGSWWTVQGKMDNQGRTDGRILNIDQLAKGRFLLCIHDLTPFCCVSLGIATLIIQTGCDSSFACVHFCSFLRKQWTLAVSCFHFSFLMFFFSRC